MSHEQMLQTYEISPERVDTLLEKLSADVAKLLGKKVPDHMRKFRTVVLLDDLSASGTSYLKREESGGFDGKIGRFYRSLTDKNNAVSRLVDIQGAEILVVLYMATERACQHLKSISKEMWEPLGGECSVIVVHSLGTEVCLKAGDGSTIEQLLDAYYDPTIEDEHTKKGGTDLRYGFAGCGLPLVLSHNTPNNSLYLLWAESENIRPLFPRVSRHRREV